MKTTTIKIAAAAFIAIAAAPAAVAQNAGDADLNQTTTEYRTVEREDNDYPWGLLGLLGLAGLLGRKTRDADIHVDARRDTRA